MAAIKKAEDQVPPEGTDVLVIKPLGAGQEVGRSCIMLEFKGKKIMLDCGIHPGLSGIDALPFVDNVDAGEIDLLLISHFHLDHCGALPWFLLKTSFKGKCFMTHATKAICRYLLADSIRVNYYRTQQMLYNKNDLVDSLGMIETIDFHEEKEVNGIRFWCYNAGHVLGAAMFMLEIAGVRILYTGDFSRQEDRHLMAAEIPNLQPHVLIMESTHGTRILEKRDEREARFTCLVHDIINRGGRCLLPVSALGNAQELMLILNEYWSDHPELHDIPIYYASALARKCLAVYKTYINSMNLKIRRQIAIDNPFDFKYILNLNNLQHFDDNKPCVIMATPGMMQRGLSRELFDSWCTDPKNGVIVTGYCVEGTMAKNILSEPEEISTITGQKLPLKMSVDNISFSAHTDYQQTSEFIRILKPPHIVLVHGEQNEMEKLKAAVIREYEDDPDVDIEVYNPRNAQSVELYFRGEKITQVIGSLTVKPPVAGRPLSGVLVKRNFSYHLLAASDISKYTELVMSTVHQRLRVPYLGTLQVLHFYLSLISQDTKLILNYKKFGEKMILQVFDAITVFLEENVAVLEWTASSVNDMYADAVVIAILKAEKSEMTVKKNQPFVQVNKMHFTKCLMETLAEMFGKDAVTEIALGEKLTVTVNEKCAEINVRTLEVKCEDELLQQMVTTSISKLYNCLIPQTLTRSVCRDVTFNL